MIVPPSSRDIPAVSPPRPTALHVLPAGEWTAEALCDRFLPEVLRWCSRLGGPYVDAEDAAHDAMLTVLQRAHTVRDHDRLHAWVFGVTRRTLAWHRRKSLWKRFVGGSTYEPVDAAAGPEDCAGTNADQHAVRELLEEMPSELREVLVLCDLEERPDAAVALFLGIPDGTVKSRLRRARAAFTAGALRRGLREEKSP